MPLGTNILSWTAKYGIQTEHQYPRSLAAAAMPALGDLHHLVPSKANINTMRKNAPFSDIPDDKTKYWLLDDKVFTRPDQKLIDHYSESTSNVLEPRESKKKYLSTIFNMVYKEMNKIYIFFKMTIL